MTCRVRETLPKSEYYKISNKVPTDLDRKLVDYDTSVINTTGLSKKEFIESLINERFTKVPTTVKFQNDEIIKTITDYLKTKSTQLAIDEMSFYDDMDEKYKTQYGMQDKNFTLLLESFERPYKLLFPGDKYDGALDLNRLNIRIDKNHCVTKVYFG